MKANLLFSLLTLSLLLWVSLSYAQSYNAGIGSGTQGVYSVHVGVYAGRSSTASNNAFLGFAAGYANTSGYHNTFLGNEAGNYNKTGYMNTFVGSHAGLYNTTGDANTFLGHKAGFSNTTGFSNIF